jgi:histone-lysine N-methyltransferase SETMAR
MPISAVEYRSVIKFLVLKELTNETILNELKLVYKDESPSRTTIYYWIAEFRRGRTSVEDDKEGRGRPAEIGENTVEQCKRLMMEDRRITIKDLSASLNVSTGSCYEIITSVLGYNKVCSRFVPKFLSADMRMTRLQCAQSCLALYQQYGDEFLTNIVTEDETPLSLYVPDSRRDSMVWKRPEEKPVLKRRSGTSHKRELMLTVFWSASGVLLVDYLEKGRTMKSDYYCNLLQQVGNLQQPAQSRSGLNRRRVWFLHDNAPIHTSHMTNASLNTLPLILLPHPPYSPDLAPSDFHLFRHLKKALRGEHFPDAESLRMFVNTWIADRPPLFFRQAFFDLHRRWMKTVEAAGSYIEK